MKRMLVSTLLIGLLTIIFMISVKIISNEFMSVEYIGIVTLISMGVSMFLSLLFHIDDKKRLELNK